jgi:hypothetical protein
MSTIVCALPAFCLPRRATHHSGSVSLHRAGVRYLHCTVQSDLMVAGKLVQVYKCIIIYSARSLQGQWMRTLEHLAKRVQRHIKAHLAVDCHEEVPDTHVLLRVARLALHYRVHVHQVINLQTSSLPQLVSDSTRTTPHRRALAPCSQQHMNAR